MPEKAPAKKKKSTPAKDLLFNRFKESVGIKVFMIKHRNEKEKIIYNKVLAVLKDKGYLDYSVNFSNIQIFLTDLGRRIVDKQTRWEIG